MRQKSIYKYCGRIGHKADDCVIYDPKFLSPSLITNINQFNALNSGEPNESSIDWNIQPLLDHFKYRTSPPKTSLVASYIIGRLNYHYIDNGDFEAHPP